MEAGFQVLMFQHKCSVNNCRNPFLAVVIDPIRIVSVGKVEFGAFRTYPKRYEPPDDPDWGTWESARC